MLQSGRMDEGRIVTPLGARRIALAVSVALHALVAGLWLHSSPHKRSADAPSRSRAAMTVRLHSVPVQAVAPPARVEAPVAAAKPLRTTPPRTRNAAAPTLPPPSQPVSIENLQPAVPTPSTPPSPNPPDNPPPAAVPGAAFAGLFAPIISRPLGNSSWGRRSITPAPAPDPQMQREQALSALRMSLLARLSDLAGRLSSSGQDLRCDIAIDGPRHLAEVQCADPADQGAPWSALHGLLLAGTVPAGSASLCFRLAGPQVTLGPCAAPPNPATP